VSESSNIAWTHSTFNPVIGCTEVSPGCDNCYAREFSKAKFPVAKWGAGMPRYRTSENNWKQPERWNRKAEKSGEPWRVFCGSLCDIFDNEWPDVVRADLWSLVANTPYLTWLLLTKRIGNAKTMAPGGFQSHVWLGATVVNQEEADRDIPKLLTTHAGKHFLSIEPMLGPISLRWLPAWGGMATKPRHWQQSTNELDGLRRIDWVIVGAESGPHRRPFDHAWLRSIVEQCKAAGVPVFVKQDSSLRPGARGKIPDDLWVREFPA
jgi:protein gp37